MAWIIGWQDGREKHPAATSLKPGRLRRPPIQPVPQLLRRAEPDRVIGRRRHPRRRSLPDDQGTISRERVRQSPDRVIVELREALAQLLERLAQHGRSHSRPRSTPLAATIYPEEVVSGTVA